MGLEVLLEPWRVAGFRLANAVGWLSLGVVLVVSGRASAIEYPNDPVYGMSGAPSSAVVGTTNQMSKAMTDALQGAPSGGPVGEVVTAAKAQLAKVGVVGSVAQNVIVACAALAVIAFGTMLFFGRPNWKWLAYVGAGVLVVSTAGLIAQVVL